MLGWIADVSLIVAGTIGFVYDLIAKHHISQFNFYPGIRLCTYLHELSLLFFSQSWLFFEKTPRPWFKEHGLVSFPNTGSPLGEYNYAFCKVSVAPFGKSGCVGVGACMQCTGRPILKFYLKGILYLTNFSYFGFRQVAKKILVIQ